MQYQEIITAIRKCDLTADQYAEISRVATEANRAVGRTLVRQLDIGDEVTFTHPRTHEHFQGKIVKINRVKAKVKVGMTNWNVPFGMLRLA